MAHDDKRPDPAPEDGPATSSESAENRLAAESSPYLLLHRHNPVDWYPWGEEALAKAREEDKPIFLSVGYSTCYWCHVMERESFSDPQIAAQMNRDLVNVKVDREERPDLDEIYMTATQILTGHGGWPNSVFLTPDLKPFYAGTYFPPEDRYGRPGFPSLLRGLVEAWQGRRTEVEQQAEELSGAMRRYIEERAEPGDAPPPASVREASAKGLFQRFDPEWGGFGGAPKFPSPSNLVLLLEVARGSGSREAAPDAAKAADMLHATLDQMARGGIYDQLAGGFHRYATDRAWRVPHFEKMLYDNGLLLDLYAREHARTKDPEMERIVRETAAFLEREMTLPGGGFASAIDAETDGHEGAYYVWTRDELQQVLGREDFDFLAPLMGFAGVPFFEDKYFVLHLPERLEVQAQRRRGSREDLLDEMEPMRRKLLEARQERKRPLTDDKVLADWNGMTIAGLATAGHLLGEELFVERAARAASFVLAELRPEGRLHHTWRGGEAKVHGLLGDYVWMVRGLLALHEATGEGDWVAAAAELAQEQERYLADERGGYFVAEERPDLLFRSKEVFDGAVPAANAVAVLNLLDLAAATGEERWHREAERVLAASAPLVEQFPDGARTLAVAAARWHAAERGGTPEEAAAEGVPVARGGTVATGTVAEGAAGAGAGGGKAAPEAGAPERGAGDSPAAPPAGAAALAAEAEKTAETRVEVGSADPEGWHAFVLRLRLAEGWHANAGSVEDPSLVATAVGAEDAGLRALELPPGEPWSAGGSDEDPHPVYRGRVEIRGELRAAGPAPALLLTWQPCDDTRCLPPVTRRLPVLG